MPEGDSVYQLSQRLKFLVGREVVHTSIRVPRFATVSFDGEQCQRIWPYGKHLFMQFGHRILHTHLKMEGSWAVHLVGDRWHKPGHTARVVLTFAGAPQPRDIEIVGHQLGLVEVYDRDRYAQRISHLGPDILAETFDIDEAARRMSARPDMTIGQALLDQKIVAGLGNEYRAEVCFLAGVLPTRKVKDVDVHSILALARRLIWANRNSPIRVTTGVRRAGENSYVFGRNHRPCRRCTTPIRQAVLGGGADGDLERIIWFCPRCQT